METSKIIERTAILLLQVVWAQNVFFFFPYNIIYKNMNTK